MMRRIGNLTSKTGLGTLTYPASGATSVRPHAVSGVSSGVSSGGGSFSYDASGNMTSRNDSGTVFTQGWDVDNRLAVVMNTVILSA